MIARLFKSSRYTHVYIVRRVSFGWKMAVAIDVIIVMNVFIYRQSAAGLLILLNWIPLNDEEYAAFSEPKHRKDAVEGRGLRAKLEVDPSRCRRFQSRRLQDRLLPLPKEG